MKKIEVSLHIIFGILRVRQTKEKIQHWLPGQKQLRDASIPVIGGVARRRAEESGDVHRRGRIFDDVLDSRFHETK